MRIMGLIMSLAWLAAGCTTVVVRGPVGQALADEEIEHWAGTWRDGERRVFQVMAGDTPGEWRLSEEEDGETQSLRFIVTRVAEDVVIFWGVSKHEGWLAPARLIEGTGAVTLVLPDLARVRAEVATGRLKEGPDLGQGWYALEADNLGPWLADNRLWDLAYGRALFRVKEEVTTGSSTPVPE